MSEMRSISSAPKDGTVILGGRFAEGLGGTSKRWLWLAPIKWFQISQWHPANWGHAYQHHAEPPFWGATHWSELPSAEEQDNG